MNDPHVEALFYRFVSDDSSELFGNAERLATTLGGFDIELADQELKATPRRHYATADDAKAELQLHLTGWEQMALLSRGGLRVRFEFIRAEVVDRKPGSGTTVHVTASRIEISSKLTARITANRASFPSPHPSYAPSQLTGRLAAQYREFKDGNAKLLPMAYGVLTELEAHFGVGERSKSRRRKIAAKELRVSVKVLTNLAKLTAVDDPTLKRKAGGTARSPTPAELDWIEAVTARLIVRVGEHNHDSSNLEQLDMAVFPKLS